MDLVLRAFSGIVSEFATDVTWTFVSAFGRIAFAFAFSFVRDPTFAFALSFVTIPTFTFAFSFVRVPTFALALHHRVECFLSFLRQWITLSDESSTLI